MQRLVALTTFAKHLTGKQLATFIVQLILTKFRIPVENVIAFARDSCAVNGVCVRSLCTTFVTASDMLCICHTLNHLGEHFELGFLWEFLSSWIHLIYSSAYAKTIWHGLIGETVVGYSNVRWYCKAEIAMQLAKNFTLIPKAINKFIEVGVGPTLAPKLKQQYESDTYLLKRQLAAMLDMRFVVATTYELEGDGLTVMLAYDRVRHLSLKGETLHTPEALPNVEAVIRECATLSVGVELSKFWAGYGLCAGKIIAIGSAQSTLYPGTNRTVYTVKYAVDGTTEDLEEEEIRPLLKIDASDVAPIANGLAKGFEYLNNRLTGNCAEQYSCEASMHVLDLVRAFDPTYAASHITRPADVEKLADIPCLGARVGGMRQELEQYRMLAAGHPGFDRSSVSEYTDALLLWWRQNCPSIPAWAEAARAIFSMSCSSAASERVFSLVEFMFGAEQKSAMADQLQAGAMLRYHKRSVG